MMKTADQIKAIHPTRSKGERREFKPGGGDTVIVLGLLSATVALVKRVVCRWDEWSRAISEPGVSR